MAGPQLCTPRRSLVGLLLSVIGQVSGRNGGTPNTFGINQHALMQINVKVRIKGLDEGGDGESPLQSPTSTQWLLTVDEVSLPATSSSAPSLTSASQTHHLEGSTAARTDDHEDWKNTLVDMERVLVLEWSVVETNTLVGIESVSFLLPLFEEQESMNGGARLATTRTMVVALWEEDLSVKPRRKRLLIRQLAHIPRTKASYDRQLQHQQQHVSPLASSGVEHDGVHPPVAKPYTLIEVDATSRCCRAPIVLQTGHSVDGNRGITLSWCAMVAALVSFVLLCARLSMRRHRQRTTLAELSLEHPCSTSEEEEEAGRAEQESADGDDPDEQDCEGSDQESESNVGGDQVQQRDDGQVGDEWWQDEQDDDENNGTHVVENTQMLLAWAERRHPPRNSGSSTDEELELPPPMERHVVRPMPSHGITFADEIERFNQLNLSSPLGSRAGRSSASSRASGRKQRGLVTQLHLPSFCGSPQPLAWDRPMLFNSPPPARRRASMQHQNTFVAQSGAGQSRCIDHLQSDSRQCKNQQTDAQATDLQNKAEASAEREGLAPDTSRKSESIRVPASTDIQADAVRTQKQGQTQNGSMEVFVETREGSSDCLGEYSTDEQQPPSREQAPHNESSPVKHTPRVEGGETNGENAVIQENPQSCGIAGGKEGCGKSLGNHPHALPTALRADKEKAENAHMLDSHAKDGTTDHSTQPARTREADDCVSGKTTNDDPVSAAAVATSSVVSEPATSSSRGSSCKKLQLSCSHVARASAAESQCNAAGLTKLVEENQEQTSTFKLSAVELDEAPKQAATTQASNSNHGSVSVLTADVAEHRREQNCPTPSGRSSAQLGAPPKRDITPQATGLATVAVVTGQVDDGKDSVRKSQTPIDLSGRKRPFAELVQIAADEPEPEPEERIPPAARSPRKAMRNRKPSPAAKASVERADIASNAADGGTLSFTYVSTLSPDSSESVSLLEVSSETRPGALDNRLAKPIDGGRKGKATEDSGDCASVQVVDAVPSMLSNKKRRRRKRPRQCMEKPELVPSLSLVTAAQNLAAPVWQFSEEADAQNQPERKSPCKSVLVAKCVARRSDVAIGFDAEVQGKREEQCEKKQESDSGEALADLPCSQSQQKGPSRQSHPALCFKRSTSNKMFAREVKREERKSIADRRPTRKRRRR